MNQSSLDKILKGDGHYSSDLVSLDFKSQSLQKFLENVVQMVNQHSKRINQIQIDKITIQRVTTGNEKLLQSNRLPQNILNTLPNIDQKKKIETYQDTITGISTNMKLNCHSIQHLYDLAKKKDDQISAINSQLSIFAKTDDTSQSIRKSTLTSKKYTDDETNKILNRLKELEMKTNKKISEFENTTMEVEKKTLWKINQCESTLLKKVTPDYVEKAIQQLQLKIHNDIKNNKSQEMNELKFNLETQKTKLQSLYRDVNDFQKQNKILLKQLNEQVKTLGKKEKIDEDMRDNQLKIKQLLIKIDRLEKREDPQDLELRISGITNQHKEKLNYQGQKVKKLENELQSINNVMSSMGGGDGGGMDPHKLCHIDGEVRRLRDSNRTNQNKLQSLDEDMKTKLLLFEERIMTTLGMLKGQDNFVSREELYESLSRLRQPVTERMTENQNLTNQLNGKINRLQIFQKATKRKIKELTRGDQLNKILDLKLGVEQAETSFGAINMKLDNLQIIFNKTKMEIQASSNFLNYLQKQMNEPQEGINIIGPKQKVFPAKCLGCGFKHNPVHQNNTMMGTDGKYYRVDLRNSFTADQQEVYGVTPSQIAMYESPVKKGKTISGRPTSSKTNLRPSSAHRFLS